MNPILAIVFACAMVFGILSAIASMAKSRS